MREELKMLWEKIRDSACRRKGAKWRSSDWPSRNEAATDRVGYAGGVAPLIGRKRGPDDLLEGSSEIGKFPPYPPPLKTPRMDVSLMMRKIVAVCATYRGQRSLERLAKEDKRQINRLSDLLQHAEGKMAPVSLAFALFRFDLGGLIKWSPILSSEAQREYEVELRSAKARSKAKVEAVTERILDAIVIGEGDEEAKSVLGDKEVSKDRWTNLVTRTTIPLIKRYWEPLVPGILAKVEDWVEAISRDFADDWIVTTRGITRVLWRFEQEVARGFAYGSVNGAKQLLGFALEGELNTEVQRIQREEINKLIRDRKGTPVEESGRSSQTRTQRPQGSKEDEQVRNACSKKSRQFTLDSSLSENG